MLVCTSRQLLGEIHWHVFRHIEPVRMLSIIMWIKTVHCASVRNLSLLVVNNDTSCHALLDRHNFSSRSLDLILLAYYRWCFHHLLRITDCLGTYAGRYFLPSSPFDRLCTGTLCLIGVRNAPFETHACCSNMQFTACGMDIPICSVTYVAWIFKYATYRTLPEEAGAH